MVKKFLATVPVGDKHELLTLTNGLEGLEGTGGVVGGVSRPLPQLRTSHGPPALTHHMAWLGRKYSEHVQTPAVLF